MSDSCASPTMPPTYAPPAKPPDAETTPETDTSSIVLASDLPIRPPIDEPSVVVTLTLRLFTLETLVPFDI